MSKNHSANYSTIFMILLGVSLVWLLVTLVWSSYTFIVSGRNMPATQTNGNPQQQALTTAIQTLNNQMVEIE